MTHYFGHALDLAPIRIAASLGARSWSPYGPRISLVRQHFADRTPTSEIALADPVTASVFAHEALHVWQRQRGRRVTWEAIPLQAGYILANRNPYGYVASEDPEAMLATFLAANVEQQGKMFEDYVRNDRTEHPTAAFEAIVAHVQSRPDRSHP